MMVEGDALWFFQLILPIVDSKDFGIEGDEQKHYYTEVERWSNIFGYKKGLGSEYGHVYHPVRVSEHVHFDGAVFCDGVLGGSNRNINHHWQHGCCCDQEICNSINYSSFLVIK